MANDAKAQRIAASGQEHARRFLTLEQAHAYQAGVLREYARLQEQPPEAPHPEALEVCWLELRMHIVRLWGQADMDFIYPICCGGRFKSCNQNESRVAPFGPETVAGI